MMKRFPHDVRGDEKLLGPFVFLGSFIAITAILLGLLSTMFYYSARGDFDYEAGSSFLLAGDEYTWIDSANPGYNVTMDNTTDRWFYHGTDPKFTVHDDVNNADYTMAMIRDQEVYRPWGEDFVGIYETWGWWSDEFDRISYEMVIEKQVPLTNASIIDFEMHRSTRYYSLIIITPSDAANHTDNIWDNEFFIGIAHAPFDAASIADVTMWGLIGMLFSASLPGIHPLLNYLITIPFWIGVAFMVFTIVSRMIPFISGG